VDGTEAGNRPVLLLGLGGTPVRPLLVLLLVLFLGLRLVSGRLRD
jgi:hypothetical protein